MTLSQAIERVLERANLSTTVEDYKDQARHYINMILAEIVPTAPWWWLDRTTTFNTADGTATYQPVSGNVAAWWSFVDQTNDRTLEIVGADELDAADPDRSLDGDPRWVHVAGLDTTTGYPVVRLLPIPDGTFTIRVRYRADVDEWTSSNDASDLLTLGVPRIIESALVYGATSLYLEKQGDDSGSQRESGNYGRVLQLAKRQNVEMQGNRRYLPVTGEEGPIIVLDSSLAVAS